MAQSQPNLVTLHGSSTAITDTQTHYACENIIVPFANSPTYEVTKTGGNTGNVHLSTGHTVYMRDGFEITDGGEFWARTSIDSGNCQAYCGDTVGMLDIGARPDTFVSLGSDSFRYQSNIIESYLPDSHVATFNSMYVSLNHVAIAEDVPGYYDGICQTDTLNDFNLDVILPIDTEDGNDGLKPVILLGAGGAFLKDGHNNPKFQLIVTEFAKRGFAMFIYEYRQGYPNDAAPEIDQGDTTFCSTLPDSCDVWEYRVRQAIYRGHQDILHAIRYLKWEAANGNEFNIDTNKLIIGGFSAAGFNALHAAYMEQTEWDAIDTNLRNDLGPLDAISDSIYAPDTVDRRMHTVDIAGVLNMWGAVVDETIFDNHPVGPPIIFFHGTCDDVVPYYKEYAGLLDGVLCDSVNNGLGAIELSGSGRIADYIDERNADGLKTDIPYELHSGCGFNHGLQRACRPDSGQTKLEVLYEVIQYMVDESADFIYRNVLCNDPSENSNHVICKPCFCDDCANANGRFNATDSVEDCTCLTNPLFTSLYPANQQLYDVDTTDNCDSANVVLCNPFNLAATWLDSSKCKGTPNESNPQWVICDTLVADCNSRGSSPIELILPETAFIIHQSSKDQLQIYPNPSSGLLHAVFHSSSAKSVSLELRDMVGKIFKSEFYYLDAGKWMSTIQINKLPNGIIMLNWKSDNGNSGVLKIVKQD